MMDSKKHFKNSQWLRWMGTLLSTGLFIWLLAKQDWKTLWLILSSLPGWVLPSVFGLYFLGIIGNSIRWYILLIVQTKDLSYIELLKTVFAGNFASNFLPSTIGGDSVRMIGASRMVGWSVSAASVIVDRVINIIAMACFFPLIWKIIPSVSAAVSGFDGAYHPRRWVLVGGIQTTFLSDLVKTLKRLSAKVVDALRIWYGHPISILSAVGISLISRLSVFLGVWILAQGMGIDVVLSQVIGVGVITYTLSLLPVSINGLGLREVTMTTLYVQLGASLEQASALVILTRFILMSETLPGALWVSANLVTKGERAG